MRRAFGAFLSLPGLSVWGSSTIFSLALWLPATIQDARQAFSDVGTFLNPKLSRVLGQKDCKGWCKVILNLVMQTAFSVILLTPAFMGEDFATKIDSAKAWRTSVAHDSRYMDLAGTSLVTRVCNGDGTVTRPALGTLFTHFQVHSYSHLYR